MMLSVKEPPAGALPRRRSLVNGRSFINSDGARIAYVAWGPRHAAETLLLIPGLGRGCDLFAPLIPALARHYRVLAIDNRGAGRSEAPPGPYSIELLARDARSVLDAAAVLQASVLGCSLGGCVALELACQAPARVVRLILVSTTPGGPEATPAAPDVWPRILGPHGRNPAERLLDQMRLALAPDFASREARRVMALVRRRLDFVPSPEAWMAQAAAGASFRIGTRLAAITAPALVVTGTEDRIVPPENSRALARGLPRARLHEIRGAGHLLPLERSATLFRSIRDFTQETPPCASA